MIEKFPMKNSTKILEILHHEFTNETDPKYLKYIDGLNIEWRENTLWEINIKLPLGIRDPSGRLFMKDFDPVILRLFSRTLPIINQT